MSSLPSPPWSTLLQSSPWPQEPAIIPQQHLPDGLQLILDVQLAQPALEYVAPVLTLAPGAPAIHLSNNYLERMVKTLILGVECI
jgi:hypothetical protein